MHAHEHAYGPSERGSVVLDLGGGIGALIIYTGQDLRGREIEISRPDAPRTHSAVRERRVQDGAFHSAVYPDLPSGRYTVWWDDSRPAGTVDVRGGAVAEFAWPTSVPRGVR
ncbi:phospholipase [Micromonospora sp. WMMA1363]|uniref:phospholipase n=1 Tax=Micromonospora sp. WMMA1363 TaxID=3053985 RepID=UPI00259CE7E4|nr:phospholipase [Micromonospora sp. WMMA1363]MDM4722588.1 phospholipase [Micromonospora sp. WMMA1363]